MGMGGAYQLTNNLNRFPLQPKANNSNLKKNIKKNTGVELLPLA